MLDHFSLVAIRRRALARCFAIALVVLTVVPVTAPFATFDLSGIIGETALHVDAGEGKLVQEVVDPAFAGPSIAPSMDSAWRHVARPANPSGPPQIQPLVLRI